MKPDSTFREIGPQTDRVTVRFGSSELSLPRGENLAGALLVVGVMPFRHTPLSGAPRGPFCMMGACYDCLVEIDGINRQACMLQVTEGLQIERPSIKGAGNA